MSYFLRLGSSGFGGPIALVGYMQRDLVEARGWFTEDEYRQGLGGMGVSFPPDLVTTCRKIVYSIIDTCTRTRAEVGCLRKA